jgi:hypothetical protein
MKYDQTGFRPVCKLLFCNTEAVYLSYLHYAGSASCPGDGPHGPGVTGHILAILHPGGFRDLADTGRCIKPHLVGFFRVD